MAGRHLVFIVMAKLGRPVNLGKLGIESLEVTVILEKANRALGLLRLSYVSNQGLGGWYHYLNENSAPGPPASACGLMCFSILGSTFDHIDEVLRFLRSRQISSPDPQLNGGWSMNSTGNQPVLEATSLALRCLGITRSFLQPDAPDILAAYHWLLHNQNTDFGWGSFYGEASRVYHTCLALQALALFNPTSQQVILGQDWLTKNRSGNTSAWGASAASPPTVFHTSIVLSTLLELGADPNNSIIKSGYAWLIAHLNPLELVEPESQVEEYSISYSEGGQVINRQIGLPHFALPSAVSALIHNGYSLDDALVYRGLITILSTQLDNGSWGNPRNPARVSIWSVWYCLQCLGAVINLPIVKSGAEVTKISGSLIVRRRSPDAPLLALLCMDFLRTVLKGFVKYWSAIVLVVFVLGGFMLMLFNWIGFKEFVIALMFPIALVVIQLRAMRS
jgi:hypothetical protein